VGTSVLEGIEWGEYDITGDKTGTEEGKPCNEGRGDGSFLPVGFSITGAWLIDGLGIRAGIEVGRPVISKDRLGKNSTRQQHTLKR
jgi:hypothetical protein